MPEVSLQIPQIGEGLQEARVVALLKQPGDTVKRDEVIYQMETDKAVMDVESPYEGKIVRWLANVDDVLPIGTDVLVMDTQEAANDAPAQEQAPAPQAQAQTPGVVALQIPQIGEGLQEARLVAKLKEPGDTIDRDEAIYQMETDKAVMDVESPYKGKVVRWLAEVDDVLPIGTNVLEIETDEAVAQTETAVADQPVAPTSQREPASTKPGERRRDIPPRTRAYAKQKGLNEQELNAVPATGKKLMPEDIDTYLQGGGSTPPETGQKTSSSGKSYSEKALPSQQRVLSSRLQRGSQLVVPGMMQVATDWSHIESLREEIKSSGSDFQPSTFTIFAFAVAKAAADHPIMRSTLVGDSTVRTYEHIQLGIAVARPGDELVVAVIEDADTLSWKDFADQTWEKIKLARDGKDQANESVTLSITNMQGHGIRDAVAVVVPPGVATIFLGEAHWGVSNDDQAPRFVRSANVGITIDHRLINGVGGAEFLNAIKHNVENIRDLVKD